MLCCFNALWLRLLQGWFGQAFVKLNSMIQNEGSFGYIVNEGIHNEGLMGLQ